MPLFMSINSISFGQSLWIAVLGIVVVFFCLVALSLVIRLISHFSKLSGKKSAKNEQAAPAAEPQKTALALDADARMVPAPGSEGEIKLNNVDEKTAALLMAIVADEIGAPLNELRFVSVRELNA